MNQYQLNIPPLEMTVTMTEPQHPSTNIFSAGFPEAVRGPLIVQFKDSKSGDLSDLGQYLDVPLSIFNALLADKSPGGFLHAQVKPFFEYRRLLPASISAKAEMPAISEAGIS